MRADRFIEILGAEFYTGVPDSQLRSLCDCLMDRFGISKEHIIAANEGNAVAIAAGYYLSTGKTPVVYLQNSGIGNIVNPVASLMNERVYNIPCIFVVGWRGEPGVHDEPQHIFQGMITQRLLEDIEIDTFVVRESTTENELLQKMENYRAMLKEGRSVSFIIAKNALETEQKYVYSNGYSLNRETAIRKIAELSGDGIVVSTTGKISRELFEIREKLGQGHEKDFLTVGSMGHSSSIALGIALQKPDRKVWCIDGDGAALMHMGALAVIGNRKPGNMVHVVINNEAHETVGGMPTVGSTLCFSQMALICGYEKTYTVENSDELEKALINCKNQSELSFVEVKAAIGSRKDLGRPTRTPEENREAFMKYLCISEK